MYQCESWHTTISVFAYILSVVITVILVFVVLESVLFVVVLVSVIQICDTNFVKMRELIIFKIAIRVF